MAKLKVVLVDLDGTLRDTRDLIYGAFQHAIKAHSGKDVTVEDIKPHVHHHTVVHMKFAGHVHMDEFFKTYSEIIDPQIGDMPLYEGTRELLGSLRSAGYGVGIVTSAPQEKAEEYLESVGLDELCDVVVGVAPDRRPKPAPDMLLEAVRQFNCEADEAIMLGDMTVDIEAAHAAGMPCIAVTHGFGARDELERAGANHIVNGLNEVISLVTSLDN